MPEHAGRTGTGAWGSAPPVLLRALEGLRPEEEREVPLQTQGEIVRAVGGKAEGPSVAPHPPSAQPMYDLL